MQPILQACGVTKNYEGKCILDSIDLSIPAGQRVALLGPSGCGKSTLLSLLGALQPLDAGQVLLHSQPYTKPNRQVAWMPQEDMLMPWATILKNVSLPLRIAGLPRKQAYQEAASYFERFGLAGYEKAWPHQLSGGMKKRAAFLRTALTGAQVMLLDEPFAALDYLTRASIHDWLLKKLEELGAAAVLVTHDIEEAVYLCERVVVLSKPPAHIVGEIWVTQNKDENFKYSEEMARLKREIAALL